MWCLISFHWGVCHYFISRVIWWASVSCWKAWCLWGEQWVHWQHCVRAPVYVWHGPDREDKIEWDRARDMWGNACCSYITVFSLLHIIHVLKWYEDKKVIWMGMREAFLSQGGSVFLCLWGWHIREGFQLLPSRRHCVCLLSTIHWETALFVVQCLLYLHLSYEGFVHRLVDVDHRWWCSSGRAVYFHRYPSYTISCCLIDIYMGWRTVWLLKTCPLEFPLCLLFLLCVRICIYKQCFERLWKKSLWGGSYSQFSINTSPDASVKHVNSSSNGGFYPSVCINCLMSAQTALCADVVFHRRLLLKNDRQDCVIVTIELAIGLVIAHWHFS